MSRRIEHVITGLGIGGAELMLSHLARGGRRFEHSVTSLSANGRLADDLTANGVAVREIGMKKNLTALRHTRRLARRLKEQRPQLVQTWLYHADLVGGLAARRAGLPVVWNLRQTEVAPNTHKLNTSIVIRLCALLSKSVPTRIVCGSKAAREAHLRMGFNGTNMVVICNGVDTESFRPDPEARAAVRAELGLTDNVPVVGRIGRYHPQKDYRGFVETARIVAGQRPDARFVLAGHHVDEGNRELAGWIGEAGLRDRCILLGARRDIARVIPALDVLVSSSAFGEGFPNIIAEAMACEVPCVATDVGDSAEIIGCQELITAPGDYPALARAALGLLGRSSAERRGAGEAARRRVAARFALDVMIDSYESLYAEVLGMHGENAPSGRAPQVRSP
jgi:glycosyltransferase involved in cell wall biosynthesis